MTPTQIAIMAFLGILVTGAVSFLTARISNRATLAKIEADKVLNAATTENAAANLAVTMMEEIRRDLVSVKQWQRGIMRWWTEHDEWDDELVAELIKLDPSAKDRLKPRPKPPIYDEPTIQGGAK